MSRWLDLDLAIAARIERAWELAHAESRKIEWIQASANKKPSTPSPATDYIRTFWRPAATSRLSSGEIGLEQTVGTIFIDILVRKGVGTEPAFRIADAIGPAFLTESDGLEFDESAELGNPHVSGEHWMLTWTKVFKRYIVGSD